MTSEVGRAIAQVDVFTSTPFSGNPAGVCIVEAWPDERWMADVSREMACSNSAFAVRRGDGSYDLRWFTAGGVEVQLCGHATMATAHMLFEDGRIGAHERIRFHSKSGELTVSRRADGNIRMDFPIEVAQPVQSAPDALLSGLQTPVVWIGRNRLDYVVELANETAVRELRPKSDELATLETRGIVVTARADGPATRGYDYVLRFFGPRVGVLEDHVTGTAHCALAPFWAERLGGRTVFKAYQASSRGGSVDVELLGDRVAISGRAITVLRGRLAV